MPRLRQQDNNDPVLASQGWYRRQWEPCGTNGAPGMVSLREGNGPAQVVDIEKAIHLTHVAYNARAFGEAEDLAARA